MIWVNGMPRPRRPLGRSCLGRIEPAQAARLACDDKRLRIVLVGLRFVVFACRRLSQALPARSSP